MLLNTIQDKLKSKSIHHSNSEILGRPSVIGYEKKFKWAWVATQMNTFIVVSNFGEEHITVPLLEKHIKASFEFAKKNYTGWPRGFQSGLGVISIVISSHIDPKAEEYCTKLKAGKKWAGFSIPVLINSASQKAFYFEKNPMWGRIYYPHFKKLIRGLIY